MRWKLQGRGKNTKRLQGLSRGGSEKREHETSNPTVTRKTTKARGVVLVLAQTRACQIWHWSEATASFLKRADW